MMRFYLSSGILVIFLQQSRMTLLLNNQSIPIIRSDPCIGNQIKRGSSKTYMEVATGSPIGVDTTSWKGGGFKGNLNFLTQTLEIKEWVTLESNNASKDVL